MKFFSNIPIIQKIYNQIIYHFTGKVLFHMSTRVDSSQITRKNRFQKITKN